MTGSTSRVQLACAYILHQRPYRESSALLEVFSETHGRVGLVVRGIRTAKSKQRGDLQAFRPLRLSWSTRGELGTLTAVEADGPVHSLTGAALYSAFYLNELLIRLLVRYDPHPGLYARYQAGLRSLAQGEEVEPVLRVFEKNLLQEVGYGLPLDYEVNTGEAVQSDLYYDYHLESGPVISDGLSAQGFIFKGSSLLAMARDEFTASDVLVDAKRLMRSALNLYLGNKPLKSRELFRTAKK